MKKFKYPSDTGHIEFVGVLPGHQGKGIAKSLINFIIGNSGYRRLILDVIGSNAAAIKVYSHCGFKEFSRKNEKRYGGGGRIFMEYLK